MPDGVVRNGVLILHGTGGTRRRFSGATYGGRLFGKGQPLDAEKYFIILPDNVGHGQSSKPSDGLRMKFPKYRYTDMVKLQHRARDQGPRAHQSQARDGHLDGRDARVGLGLHVSGFRRGPRAAGEQPGRDRRPQSRVAQVPDRRDRDRSDVEERRLHRAAARHGERDRLPDDGDQRAAAVAEAVSDDRGGGQVRGRSGRGAVEEHRRERHALLLPRDRGLQPGAAPVEDHGAAAGDQLGRRLREPARAADDAGADQAGEEGPLRPAADHRCDPRPRHPLAARDLGRGTGKIPGGSFRCRSSGFRISRSTIQIIRNCLPPIPRSKPKSIDGARSRSFPTRTPARPR